jgi:hypothetical protein
MVVAIQEQADDYILNQEQREDWAGPNSGFHNNSLAKTTF